MLHKKNAFHPFEGGNSEASLEFLGQRHDAAFALMATHSKKRPHTLLLTRFFDGHVMDMVELAISNLQSIKTIGDAACAVGTKPAFVFTGELFEQREDYKNVQNLLLDFFRGRVVDEINLAGLQSVISVTATEEALLFRVYRVLLKRSGTRTPLIQLQLMGPSMDLKIGRTRFAPRDLMKQALRQPKELKPKKEKNMSTTGLGETLGRVHVGDQKLATIQTRKMKALKNKKPRVEQDDSE